MAHALLPTGEPGRDRRRRARARSLSPIASTAACGHDRLRRTWPGVEERAVGPLERDLDRGRVHDRHRVGRAREPAVAGVDFGSAQRSSENLTSSAVTGVPSENMAPSRSVNVQVRPSSLVVHDSANAGMGVGLSPTWTSPSQTWLMMKMAPLSAAPMGLSDARLLVAREHERSAAHRARRPARTTGTASSRAAAVIPTAPITLRRRASCRMPCLSMCPSCTGCVDAPRDAVPPGLRDRCTTPCGSQARARCRIR